MRATLWIVPPQLVDHKDWRYWYLIPKTENELFQKFFCVQEYKGLSYIFNGEANKYRIITRSEPSYEVARGFTLKEVDELVLATISQLGPEYQNVGPMEFSELLPLFVVKLQQDSSDSPLDGWHTIDNNDGLVQVDTSDLSTQYLNSSIIKHLSDNFALQYKFEDLPKKFYCSSCGRLANNPHKTKDNSTLCFPCARFCSVSSPDKIIKPNPVLAAELNCQNCYCPFSSFGCQEYLPKSLIDNHVADCPFIKIECPHDLCTFTANTAEAALQHILTCEHVHVSCIGQKNWCQNCADTTCKAGETCKFHPGYWNGYMYTQVQEWKFAVAGTQIKEILRLNGHLPREAFKSSASIAVGFTSFLGFGLGATAFAHAISSVVPILSPGLVACFLMLNRANKNWNNENDFMYYALYKYPYKLLWGDFKTDCEKPTLWTCCNGVGVNAKPCRESISHVQMH